MFFFIRLSQKSMGTSRSGFVTHSAQLTKRGAQVVENQGCTANTCYICSFIGPVSQY